MNRLTAIKILLVWAAIMGAIYLYGMNARQAWKSAEAACIAKGGVHIKVEGETVCAKIEVLK